MVIAAGARMKSMSTNRLVEMGGAGTDGASRHATTAHALNSRGNASSFRVAWLAIMRFCNRQAESQTLSNLGCVRAGCSGIGENRRPAAFFSHRLVTARPVDS